MARLFFVSGRFEEFPYRSLVIASIRLRKAETSASS